MTVTSIHFPHERTMVDYQRTTPVPHRKPLPEGPESAYYQSFVTQPSALPPRNSSRQAPQDLRHNASPNSSQHSRTRTTSSSVFPTNMQLSASPSRSTSGHSGTDAPSPPLQQNFTPTPITYQNRRFSASTTGSGVHAQLKQMQRQGTSTSSAPRRSTSSRSVETPSSYVALMRKQKATVWCDRSQNIDARTAAAQKAAKHRAAMEIHNNLGGASKVVPVAGGGMVGKIRHHGVPKAPGYVAPNLSGAGVPLRLSANEMLGDEENEGRSLTMNENTMTHGRSGSGRSSTKSDRYPSGYPRPQGRHSASGYSTPPSNGESPKENIPELQEVPNHDSSAHKEYFYKKPQENLSSDSQEEQDHFGEMKAPSAADRAAEAAKKAEELRRRGSVDERAMSMRPTRLFVANPDLSD